MSPSAGTARLPLFPLPNVVHFPATPLDLHVFEPRYRRLVSDLLERDPGERRIGMVLIKPGAERGDPLPDIFPAGTAGLMTAVEALPDGRSNIRLEGTFRFTVEREIGGAPYRQAVVTPVAEPQLDERDAGVVAVREALSALLAELAAEAGENFPVEVAELLSPTEPPPFERLVNRVAAELDVPVLRKIHLLDQTVPERALELLHILRSRRRVIRMLRPYRHLSQGAKLN